jgi:thioredoxin reductase
LEEKSNFDVIIIGGSYAGLSAAMALGRSLRKVLVIDSGLPCNRQTPHSHNFITQDGEKPAEIARKAKLQVSQYPTVSWLQDYAEEATREGFSYTIKTRGEKLVTGKKLIFATGVEDLMPDIPGFAEAWGISVIHCPYCHGYEVRGQKTGILANGEAALHYAQLIRNWTSDLTIYTNGPSVLTGEEEAKIRKHGIEIVSKKITELRQDAGHLGEIVFDDQTSSSLVALYARPPFRQHCSIPVSLGCELTEHGLLKTDSFHKTNIEGVFACGDASSPMRSVANAVASGGMAGAMANSELLQEEF